MKICRVFSFKIDERSIKKKTVTVSAYLNMECSRNNTLLQWRVYFCEPRSFYFHGNSRARCIGAL